MGLFDHLKRQAMNAAKKTGTQLAGSAADKMKAAAQNLGNRSEKVAITAIPSSFGEFTAMAQAALSNPFDTAALTVVALCVYPYNKEESIKMLNYLRGPRPLSAHELSFIADRFRDKDYVPRSYFEGATPKNDYEPQAPYAIVVSENPYSYQNAGYAMLYIRSGGADSPRSVQLREAKDGKWYLWEQFLLVDIRQPDSMDPWA